MTQKPQIIDGLDFSRDDLTRIRFALQSAQLSCKAASKDPGDKMALEAHQLNSINSRVIALIEMGSEGTTYAIASQAAEPTGSRNRPAGRLPGLGS